MNTKTAVLNCLHAHWKGKASCRLRTSLCFRNGSPHRRLETRTKVMWTLFSPPRLPFFFFLILLSEPHSGFRIAFNMFDTDGNQIVDKREFLVVSSVLYLNIIIVLHLVRFCQGCELGPLVFDFHAEPASWSQV